MDQRSLRRVCVLSLVVAVLLLLPLTLLGAAGTTNSGLPPREAVAPGRPEIVPPVTSKVLVYDDDWVHTPTGPERALTALAIPYTLVGTPSAFVSTLALQEWDLVIFANENNMISSATLDALQAYLAASNNHKAIVQTWQASGLSGHPIWATLGVTSPVNLTSPTSLHWWSEYHPLFHVPNEVPDFTDLAPPGSFVYGASATLAGSSGPGLGGFAGSPTAGQAGMVLSPDNRTIYKGLLDFCNDQDANANGTWDVQEWWENAIRTLYPRKWRVLLVISDSWGVSAAVNNLALYPDVQSVTTFDASSATPTLNQLEAYDVVIPWSANPPYADPAELGDMLADYVDAGGRVVCAALNWDPPTYVIGGRFVTGGYTPLTGVGLNLNSWATLGTHTASHRLFWGVSAATSFYRDMTALAPGATLVASWSDGWPFVATLGRVVAINAYVGAYSGNVTSGDITTLFHNAIAYATSPRVLIARADVTGINAQMAALRNMGDVALVDEMDVHSTTPTLDQLRAYDVVLNFSMNSYANSVLMGDVLADYVDVGGHLVLGTFNWYGAPYGLEGRIMGPSYSPFNRSGPSLYSTANLGSFNPRHPLMQGVSQLTAFYRDGVSFNPGATPVASWTDGAAAAGVQGAVAAFNGYLGGNTGGTTTGDWTTLLHNIVGGLFYLNASTSADVYSGSADLPVNFSCTVNGSAPPYTFAWGFGDMGVSSDQNPAHTYTDAGTYEVTLTVTDGLGRMAQARPFTIVVDPPLAISPTVVPTAGSAPLPVAFAANASGGTPPYTYDWDFGDGTAHGTVAGPSHTYNAAGGFTPTLTVTDSQSHTLHWPGVLVTVGAPLAVSSSALPSSGGVPLTVAFASLPSGGTPPFTYDWDFGDGTAHETTQNPGHTFSSQGSFTVTLTVNDNQAHTASATPLTVTVGPALSVTASAGATTGSAPFSTTFNCTPSGGAPPYSYDWNYGDGTAHGTAKNPSHTYASAGTFTVNLTVTDNNSVTASATPITITVTPALTVTTSATPTSGSAPMPVVFTGSPAGGTPPYTYDWNYGDGTSHGTAQSPSHTYAQGSFGATLTVSDAASHTASAAPISITVTAPLSGSITPTPSSGSVPLTVAFALSVSGGTPPLTYDWNFGDGSTHDTVQNPSHTYNAIGTFTATVTVTDSAPSHHTVSASTIITVKPPPPVITLMKKASPPFTIVVTGSNLQNGIQVYINGSLWSGVLWKKPTKIKITGGASLKAVVPKGVPTTFRFVNPDTGETTQVWNY